MDRYVPPRRVEPPQRLGRRLVEGADHDDPGLKEVPLGRGSPQELRVHAYPEVPTRPTPGRQL